MALIELTKRAVRQQVLLASDMPDDIIVGETASAAAVGSVTFSQLSGMFIANHFKGGQIRAVVSGSTETKRIASSTAAGVITPASNFSGSPDTTNIEVIRANLNFTWLDNAVERAIAATIKRIFPDAASGYAMLEPGRFQVPAPSSYVAIDDDGVLLERGGFTGDRCWTSAFSSTRAEYAVGAATTAIRRAQGIQVTTPVYVAAVWLLLRKRGAGSALTVSIQADSSGDPVGTPLETLATASLAASDVSTTLRWVRVALGAPVRLEASTQYHLVVEDAGASATDYTMWVGDTSAGYTYGTGKVYDSGGASWSSASTDYLFRLQRPDDECDYRPISRDEWRVVPGTTRMLAIKPRELPSSPVPVQFIGQVQQAEIAGTTNDGTTITGDPEVLTSLATAYLLETLAVAKKDLNIERLAKMRKEAAMELLYATETRLRGRILEAV